MTEILMTENKLVTYEVTRMPPVRKTANRITMIHENRSMCCEMAFNPIEDVMAPRV